MHTFESFPRRTPAPWLRRVPAGVRLALLALLLAVPAIRAANNSAPVANPDSYTLNEDTTLSVIAPGVLGNDTDADGNALSTVLVSNVLRGTLTLNANGSFTYLPKTNYFGTDSFIYRARDSAFTSGPVTVTITINPTNDVPLATNDTYSVNSDTPLTVTLPGVLANDTDVDGDPLSALLASNPAHGSVALGASGAFTYTPSAGYGGSDSFTYRASDGKATSAVATVSITVIPAPIVVVTPPQSQTNCVGNTAVFSVTATGTGLTFQWLKGNTTLAGKTNSTLMLANLATGDAGTYNLRITGATNSVTNSATLTVNTPATGMPMTNLIRFVGSIAIFNTVTNGTGPHNICWLKDGGVIPDQTNSSLVLSNLALTDSGTYSAVVKTACGNATNFATLTVANCFPSVDVMVVIDRSGSMSGQPYTDARTACTNLIQNLQFGPTNDMAGFVIYNTNSSLRQTLTNNATVLKLAVDAFPPATNGTCISCGLTNAQAELTSARRRSNALPVLVLMTDGLPTGADSASNVLYHAQQAKNAGTRVFTVGLGAVNSDLLANAASSTNDFFFTTNSAQLATLFDTISTLICRPPTNIFGPDDVTVCAGNAANFHVTASGCAGFTYQWRKDGVNIAGQTNSTISFNSASVTNAGIYSVVVSSPCRTVTNSATLTVNSPARITTAPAGQISFVGSNVTFSVAATGTALSYEWRRGGALLSTSNTLVLDNLTTNDAGAYCVTVTSAACGGLVMNCATLTISNRAPVAVNDAYVVDEDTTLIVSAPGVLGNDTDSDGDTLTTVLVSGPAHGTLTLNPDGGFIYTPNPNFNGPDSFTYRATDGSSNSNPATVSIGVTPVNDVPVARNDAYTVTADTTLTVAAPGVLTNDTDVENDPLKALLESNPTHGTLTLNLNGSFTYQPDTNYSGSDSFTYRACDGGATSAVATVTITVQPVPVVIVTPPVSRTNCPGDTATFMVTATGTALTYQWSFNDRPLAGVTNRTLAVSDINATNGGTYCVVVNGAAGGPLTNCAQLVVNQNVIVTTPPSNQTVCENTSAQFTVGATGTGLSYQWFFGTNALVNQTNATLTLNSVSVSNAGLYQVIVSGVCGVPVTNSATLTVNENVVIVTPPSAQTSFVGSNATFSVGATGTGLTYQWFFNNALVGTNSTLALGNLATNQAGTYCVVVSGACGRPATNCTTLTIQNRAPFAANDAYSVNEDTTLAITAPGVLANDGDLDGDTLTAVLVTATAHGALTLNASGAFTYTPSLNYTGLDTFTYRANDTKLDSGLATVTITILPVNDAPVANNDNYSVNEDTTLTISAAGVLANDTDVDGDPLTAVLASNPAHGTLNLSASGAFTYTPSLNYTGLDTFTYRATDGALTSGVATVTITITPVNDAPVAVNDAYTINEDTILNLAAPGVLANDSDVDGDPLTAVLVGNPAHGTVTLGTNGGFIYTPVTNYNGPDTFTYRATDGALTSGVATVTITINATNDAPAAINDDAYTTLEDTTLTVPARGILTNDLDVDGDVLTALLVTTTAHGTLNLATNGTFTYTPSLNYTGLDTFTYRATDGALTSDVATVTIRIIPVNDAPVAANDSYSVNEDTTLTVPGAGILANDSDVDGDPLTAVLVTNVAHGTLNLSPSGAFTYTPSLNYTGLDTFTYRAFDSQLTSGVATVTITILPVNDAPVAVNDTYTAVEDTTLTIPALGVLANDLDVDGDPLSSVLVTNVTHGTLNLSANGAFTYTPSLNYTGLDTFSYRATDGALTSGVATVTITITPVNDAPVAVNDAYSVNEDTTLTIPAPGVLANDIDVDGDPLTSVLVTNVTHGTLNLLPSGAFTYTPSLNYTGADTFAYRATDGALTSGVAIVTITILPVNDAPVAVNDNYTAVEDTTLTIPAAGVLANDSDVDGDPLTAVLVANVLHGTLNLSASGAFTYTPSLNYTGLDTFTYRATDGALTSAVATVMITITPVNDAPVANADAYTAIEDTALTISAPGVLANDTDVDGDPLRVATFTLPAHGTLSLIPTNGGLNGAFTYTPSLNYTGQDTFTYRATDGALTSGVAIVTITITPVNDAPVAVNDNYTAIEDTTLTVPALGVLANDIDVDGDPLTSLLVTNVTHGTLALSTNGAFTYTPSLNYTGVDTFSYRATDGALTSGVATVTITITPVNDAPVAVNDSYTAIEDTTLTVPALGVLANDIDVDGDALTSLLVTNVTHGTLTLSTNGAFTYTPSLNYTGSDFFAYRATDGSLTSGVAIVTITITPVNDTPVAVDDSYTVAEDTTLTILAPGVLANDTDVDGDTLRVASFSLPAHGTLNLNRTNGAFVYTPSLNYTGLDTFTYRATDTLLTSAVATVRITITPVNDAPVANADSYTAIEDTTLTINAAAGVLLNDSDVDGDPLLAVLASNPAHGTLNLSASGAFTYTPSLNYTGLDTFTYRATDGALTSGVATVTITITPVNDAPVATDDAYTINEDTILNLAAPGVLANDSDVDGDPLAALLVANPAHGTLSLNANGSFRYTPNTNFNGTDTFTYRATDGALTSGVATVTITINPTNDAPAAISDDAYVTLEDTVLTVPPGGVLTNDVDVDADLLVAVLVSTTTNGTLTLSTNGGFVYVPNTNFNGVDHFTYRATDGALTSDVATVTITVRPVNDAPVAVSDLYSVNEDTPLVISVPGVLSNDLDVDGDALATLLVSDVQHGTLNLSTNGAFTYTPSLNYTGTDTFTYRATDGALTSDVATVTITIMPVNDAPVAAGDSYSVNEDTTLTVLSPGVLVNDSDVDGDPLSSVLVSDVAHGTLSLDANGAFTYTPSLNYTGTDTFTYRATDGALTSGVATVTITIIPVNDPPVTGIEGDSYTVLEDHTLTVAKPGVLANDFDVDGDALQAVFVSGPAHGTLVLNANGSFTYVPAANYFGPDSFIYRASDGLTSSAPASVSLTVTPVNDAPGFVSAGDQQVNRNAPAQTVPNWATSLSVGPANEAGQTLAFLVSNDNPSLFSVQPAIAPNGTLTYTPAANTFGVANVHVFLRDNGGTANGGADTSGEVVFRIAVNSPPSVSIISPANGVGLLAPATFSVVASASDPDGTVTNVLFMLNGTNFTSVAQAPFYFVMSNAVPGNYQWRAVATDNAGLSATSAVVNIEVITNTVVASGPIVLNHQNGLFEQFVTVSNRTSGTWANGVRLFVRNLDTTNKVYNATGTNAGVPYLDKIVSVPPGGMVTITVQYYVPNPRVIPVPTLVATPLPFTTVTVRPQLTRPSRVEGGMLPLQFTTQSGRFYFIQHSEDLVRWTTEPAAVAGTGAAVVVPQSAAGDKRFYRVLLIP